MKGSERGPRLAVMMRREVDRQGGHSSIDLDGDLPVGPRNVGQHRSLAPHLGNHDGRHGSLDPHREVQFERLGPPESSPGDGGVDDERKRTRRVKAIDDDHHDVVRWSDLEIASLYALEDFWIDYFSVLHAAAVSFFRVAIDCDCPAIHCDFVDDDDDASSSWMISSYPC